MRTKNCSCGGPESICEDCLVAAAIEEHDRKLVERLETEDAFQIDEGIYYGQEVDITEVPEGLMAEMAGLRKGWEACKKVVIEELLAPYKPE